MTMSESQRRYYEKNKDVVKRKAAARKLVAEPSAKERERSRVRARAHYARYPERQRLRKGLPIPTRPVPDVCECCGRPPGKRSMHLDHCHLTGAFRGWLCGRCNKGIGALGDYIGGVTLALQYLQRAYRVQPQLLNF